MTASQSIFSSLEKLYIEKSLTVVVRLFSISAYVILDCFGQYSRFFIKSTVSYLYKSRGLDLLGECTLWLAYRCFVWYDFRKDILCR